MLTAHPSNDAYLTFQFDKKLKEFINRGGDSSLAQRVARFASERRHLLQACTVPVLCHNDFHPRNILATKIDGRLRLSGVLDFENAHAADPLMDLAKTLYCAPNTDETKREALLAGYGPLGQDNWRELVAYYHLYYILEYWCWMVQLGNKEPLACLAKDMERYVIE